MINWLKSVFCYFIAGIPVAFGFLGCTSSDYDKSLIDSLYSNPVSQPSQSLRIFHLGHSLVGRDMPAMLKQLGGAGHDYRSQLGWGTSLKEHWEPGQKINGFEVENQHPNFMPIEDSINAGSFDAFALTEMVEIKDAIKYHDSAKYLAKFAKEIHDKNTDAGIYFYESWHHFENQEQWLSRLKEDYFSQWQDKILFPAIALNNYQFPIYVVPVGQVLRKLFESKSDMEKLALKPEALFSRSEDGQLDNIHFNDLGLYVVALTHYAVLYKKSPVGLPENLQLASGELAVAFDKETAKFIQTVVWDTVVSECLTGIVPCEPSTDA